MTKKPKPTLVRVALSVAAVFTHLRHGKWEAGIGWWEGSTKVFDCSRSWYDGYWYGFRLGPFWAGCHY